LPLDAVFTDHTGKTVKLGDYFDGKRPVILTLNYYRCPMLCGLILNGMVDGLRELDWAAGDQFRIVTCSFDPMETERLAKVKRQNYLDYYARPEAAGDQGWAFLVGTKTNVDPLLETTGFKVAWNEKRQEWMHAAALILCTPDGRISRYLYGIQFEPKTLRLSLVEASAGKIGTTVDRVLLFCYHFDGEGYALHAMNIVRAGAVMTMLVVGAFLLYWWRREVRRARAQATPALPTV
jgi:protein SCO1/2